MAPDYSWAASEVGILHPTRQGSVPMGETLLQFQRTITGPDGVEFEARACGGPMTGNTWQGWIEFVPVGGGEPVRTPRETTQPNRADTEYWATGLTEVYLEGALRRALSGSAAIVTAPREPSMFAGPAPHSTTVEIGGESVLDPFSVYEKGESLLRRQLGALSAWHLVNIIVAYGLSTDNAAVLNRMPAAQLIETIVASVKVQRSVAAKHA
jgi:hypothetical protein